MRVIERKRKGGREGGCAGERACVQVRGCAYVCVYARVCDLVCAITNYAKAYHELCESRDGPCVWLCVCVYVRVCVCVYVYV